MSLPICSVFWFSVYDPKARLQLESKEKERARGVLSPDRADALMLALCKPPQQFEYHSIRELQSRETSFAEDDPNDYPPTRPLGRLGAGQPGSPLARRCLVDRRQD